jgi:phage tail-like protein
MSIMIYGPKVDELVYKFDIKRAYPVKWVGPDMRTEAGAVAIETLEIAHEGFTVSRK